MGKLRYLGDQAVSVPLLDREVQPDELVEVPDAIAQEYAWAESLWDIVDSGKPVFDPGKKTVAEVNAYLEKADEEERARVLAAEREGQARKGVLDNYEVI